MLTVGGGMSPPAEAVPEQCPAGLPLPEWQRPPRHAVALPPSGPPFLRGRRLDRAQHPQGEHLQPGRQHGSEPVVSFSVGLGQGRFLVSSPSLPLV